MKKTIMTIAAVAALIFGSSCNREVVPTLDVDSRTLSATSEGGTFTFNVISNSDWTVSSDQSGWVSFTPTSGTGDAAVTVTVGIFTEAIPRTAKFVITGPAPLSTDVTLTQTGPAAPAEPGKTKVFAIANAGEFEVEVPAGFTYTASPKDSWVKIISIEDGLLKFSVESNFAGTENRTTSITANLTDGTLLETVEVEQSWRNVEPGELLIEEVYFAGSHIEGSSSADGDQYIRLTNNADHTVYADRILFVMSETSSQVASTGAYYAYPDLPDHIGINTMYMIPGDGDDVALEPGKSLILAISAQNFKEGNASSFDLSKADFEFYDDNDIYPDTDNPDVANLDCWFKSSFTITQLHQRGYESLALAYLPANYDAESFMAEFPWNGKKVMDWNGFHFERDITDAYLIPNKWVIDGINMGVEEFFGTPAFNATIDAGYTGCGKLDNDPDRYGKSARRISKDGKLADTNNSTNDFQRDATPSLAE